MNELLCCLLVMPSVVRWMTTPTPRRRFVLRLKPKSQKSNNFMNLNWQSIVVNWNILMKWLVRNWTIETMLKTTTTTTTTKHLLF